MGSMRVSFVSGETCFALNWSILQKGVAVVGLPDWEF